MCIYSHAACRCPWRAEEVQLQMTVRGLDTVLGIKSGFSASEPSIQHEGIFVLYTK